MFKVFWVPSRDTSTALDAILMRGLTLLCPVWFHGFDSRLAHNMCAGYQKTIAAINGDFSCSSTSSYRKFFTTEHFKQPCQTSRLQSKPSKEGISDANVWLGEQCSWLKEMGQSDSWMERSEWVEGYFLLVWLGKNYAFSISWQPFSSIQHTFKVKTNENSFKWSILGRVSPSPLFLHGKYIIARIRSAKRQLLLSESTRRNEPFKLLHSD